MGCVVFGLCFGILNDSIKNKINEKSLVPITELRTFRCFNYKLNYHAVTSIVLLPSVIELSIFIEDK